MVEVVLAAVGLALAGVLAWASAVDWRTGLIPNECVVAIVALWVVAALADSQNWARGAVGALLSGGFVLAAALLFERATGRFAFGGGDVKLVAALGLHLGAEGALLALAIGCVVFLAAAPLLRRRRGSHTAASVVREGARCVGVGAPSAGAFYAETCEGEGAGARAGDAFAFGPFLSLGAVIVMVCGCVL